MRSILLGLALVLAACEPPRMALPTSRNETATPSDPVPSTTINDLQDCVIGSKFPSTRFVFPGFAFQNLAGAGSGNLGTGRFVGIGNVIHRLPFAPGTLIEEISFAVDQRNSGNAYTLGIGRSSPVAASYQQIPLFSLTGIPIGHHVETADSADLVAAGIASTIPAAYAYSLFAIIPDADQVLYGVEVVASRL